MSCSAKEAFHNYNKSVLGMEISVSWSDLETDLIGLTSIYKEYQEDRRATMSHTLASSDAVARTTTRRRAPGSCARVRGAVWLLLRTKVREVIVRAILHKVSKRKYYSLLGRVAMVVSAHLG